MNEFQFELGQKVYSVMGRLTVRGRTKFMVPESYLVEIDGEQVWLVAGELKGAK